MRLYDFVLHLHTIVLPFFNLILTSCKFYLIRMSWPSHSSAHTDSLPPSEMQWHHSIKIEYLDVFHWRGNTDSLLRQFKRIVNVVPISATSQQREACCHSRSQNLFPLGNVGKLSATVALDVKGLSAISPSVFCNRHPMDAERWYFLSSATKTVFCNLIVSYILIRK
jgi:hypothetical protein